MVLGWVVVGECDGVVVVRERDGDEIERVDVVVRYSGMIKFIDCECYGVCVFECVFCVWIKIL